ncbi:DUF6079 family protein [Methanogenium cariaci]|uniref:DUF6079 family protein n=1 Tax=Methanogenium cariaci TaxID=2197 RepID=UPI00078468FD|nr:DUF6079 family protein [Methanogenium cariaci]
MTKICDLVNFEKIKDVIDIDALGDEESKKGLVEKYLISSAIEDHLVDLCNDFASETHKAAQIIGGYGSGKSHLLGLIISILSDTNLVQYIQNENVRNASKKIGRDFIVVHWELQPNDVELSEYFYDAIEQQLSENYGIEYRFKIDGVVDHKKNILDLLYEIKKSQPTRGLVVVVDEISDFLKQKTKEKITRDIQFLRVLGQAAQECDFTFIGAMQEHIFTNPKYVDEAESFGRVSERFQIITIKREDIKRVIAKRVVGKSPEQRLELESLFSEYEKYYPTIRNNLDDYINLYPVHPYVIQIFSELPYFEKRGAIQFTMQEVESILGEDFPSLITYDRIFDEINSKHTVKHLDSVSPVVDAVQTLDSKIDLLDARHQNTARKLVKALAILKLYGKSTNNGATVQELSNTLLLLPQNQIMEATDEVELVLTNLRKVTDGQFISRSKDGYYFLDLESKVDYEQVIERKTDNLSEDAPDHEILEIVKDQLLLETNGTSSSFADTCRWNSRRSFREGGQFIYENGKGDIVHKSGDYQIVFASPFCANKRYRPAQDCVVIEGTLSAETQKVLRRLAAARALINDNYQRSIIQKYQVKLRKQFTEMLVSDYLQFGTIDDGSGKKKITSLISREFSNFEELFSEIKPDLFDDYFDEKYPDHPRFGQQITRDNIKGEFSRIFANLTVRSGTQTALVSNTASLLNAMNLVDERGNLSTGNSDVAQSIIKEAKNNAGQNVAVQGFVDTYAESPYGFDPVMTRFVLAVLTFNGEIALKARGGKTITSSDVEGVFKSGFDAFENIPYLTLESEFDIQPVISLFTVLGISGDPSRKLRSSSKRSEAIQAFRTRYLEIIDMVTSVNRKIESLSLAPWNPLDVESLREKHELLNEIPIGIFDKVRTPNDLKKIVFDKEKIDKIADAVSLLHKLNAFYEIYTSDIEREAGYVVEVRRILKEYPDIFIADTLLEGIEDAFALMKNLDLVIEPDGYNQLRGGKLQQIMRKYRAIYYQAHEMYVGGKVDWSCLSDVSSGETYQKLRMLKSVDILNRVRFNKIEDELSSLSRLRCTGLNADILEKKVQCPNCSFPNGLKVWDIGTRIGAIESEVTSIYTDWEETILAEVGNYRDNIQFLSPKGQSAVNELIQNGRLPDQITGTLVIALNNLFKELEMVEITPEQFVESVFGSTTVMDYSTFKDRLDAWKQALVAGKDLDKTRITLAQQRDDES